MHQSTFLTATHLNAITACTVKCTICWWNGYLAFVLFTESFATYGYCLFKEIKMAFIEYQKRYFEINCFWNDVCSSFFFVIERQWRKIRITTIYFLFLFHFHCDIDEKCPTPSCLFREIILYFMSWILVLALQTRLTCQVSHYQLKLCSKQTLLTPTEVKGATCKFLLNSHCCISPRVISVWVKLMGSS